MAQPKLLSWLRPSVARLQRRLPVRLYLETLEDRVVPSALVTLQLDNQSGLSSSQYSIYVFGYGQANTSSSPPVPAMALQSNGQFTAIPANSSGTLSSFNLSTMPAITLDSATPVNGGILYFLVEPNGQAPPTISYSTDSNDVLSVTGIPSAPSTSNPPFSIVEFTEPADGTSYPSIDTSVVSNFGFPITVTLNDGLGQVGQPSPNPSVNRESIVAAYTSFMDAQGSDGTPYQNLVFAPNSIAGQAGGIVNPTLYLAALPANSSDSLKTVWDNTLTQLFGTTAGGGGMKLSMIGDDGDYYAGTPKNETIGVNTYRVLDFVGYDDAGETIANENEFWIFSPLNPDPNGTSYKANESAGQMVFGGDNVFNDQSANVLGSSSGPTPSKVALGLERDIDAALNRGVALLGPSNGLFVNGQDDSSYWGTETNWYPAGQTENLYSLFMHTATIDGTTIFTLPSGAVHDARGTYMAQAYGFAFDENPGHGPANQPNVPSKFDPVPTGTTTATITLDPWFQSPSSSPSPGPSPSSSSSSANASPFELVIVFILAQDEFTFLVDGVFSRFTNDPLFTQAADRAENLLNDLIFVDNSALFTGLNGLQSAIDANPYCDSMWGSVAEAVALDSAAGVFAG